MTVAGIKRVNAYPQRAGPDGKFYGTSQFGGSLQARPDNNGVTTSGAFPTIYRGFIPFLYNRRIPRRHALALGANGAMCGTTAGGGTFLELFVQRDVGQRSRLPRDNKRGVDGAVFP